MRLSLLYSIQSLVAIPLTPKYMTLNDLEWPFYVKFSLLRTALSEIILHTFPRAYLYHVTSGDVRKRTVKIVIRIILRIRERIADLS